MKQMQKEIDPEARFKREERKRLKKRQKQLIIKQAFEEYFNLRTDMKIELKPIP